MPTQRRCSGFISADKPETSINTLLLFVAKLFVICICVGLLFNGYPAAPAPAPAAAAAVAPVLVPEAAGSETALATGAALAATDALAGGLADNVGFLDPHHLPRHPLAGVSIAS